jgi:hypothetical protein
MNARPLVVGAREIVFGVDAGRRCLAHPRNAHREAVRERSELLKALDPLERVHRQRDPRRERLA